MEKQVTYVENIRIGDAVWLGGAWRLVRGVELVAPWVRIHAAFYPPTRMRYGQAIEYQRADQPEQVTMESHAARPYALWWP